VGANAGGAQLRDDYFAVRYDFAYSGCFDTVDEFVGSESAFTGGAPNVDSFGIQYDYPRIYTIEPGTQVVETHFVIRRNQNRGIFVGVADGV
jgi:hypothetical protein